MFHVTVLPGDGIGPEIVGQALKVLDRVAELYGHTFHYTDVDMGGCAIDKYGDPLPQAELEKCLASDSVLLGAVGGNKWNDVPGHLRPEKGLLRLRAGMGVYSNNRPAKIWPQLADASPLKKSIVEKGIDFIIVRELIGGIYFGEHKTEGDTATDILKYSEKEIERILRELSAQCADAMEYILLDYDMLVHLDMIFARAQLSYTMNASRPEVVRKGAISLKRARHPLLDQAKAAAHRMGVSPGIDPFMTLSFMSLPVIPALKITTHGVFDVEQWKYI